MCWLHLPAWTFSVARSNCGVLAPQLSLTQLVPIPDLSPFSNPPSWIISSGALAPLAA